MNYPSLDFFAGSGLVSYGLQPFFKTEWANDISDKKADVFRANHNPNIFKLGPIESVKGANLPKAVLSWGSFPCQDLSLAGKQKGIDASRSGLVWHWLRVIDELKETPGILVAENVLGLLSADNGENYRTLHQALAKRGYLIGPIVLNSVNWVPQSRPRVFIIAVKNGINLADFSCSKPNWMHPSTLQRACLGLESMVWWKMKRPSRSPVKLEDIVEHDAPCDHDRITKHYLELLSPLHRNRLKELDKDRVHILPGYKRTRNGKQVLELRFDGVAGCLRTPNGGSSRQELLLKVNGKVSSRLITVREAARLMGAPETFKIPGGYNDGYHAMGDAVVVPVANYLAEYLLYPLARRINEKP